MTDIYEQVAEKIIHEQESIIGPLALEQANRVEGLEVKDEHVKLSGNHLAVLDNLVEQYRKLFGQTSVEVCKEAAGSLLSQLSPEKIPASLR